MNVVDSSGWVEYLAGRHRAEIYTEAIESPGTLVVPAICIFEVFRVIRRQLGENKAHLAVSAMRRGIIVDLTIPRAVASAEISRVHSLSMADSIILSAAQEFRAVLWTGDRHFKDIPGVRYLV